MKFNSTLFGATLYNKRHSLRLGLREVAQATGLSVSTLSRIENGVGPIKKGSIDMDSFVAICNWLEAEPGQFFVEPGEGKVTELPTIEQVEDTLRASPEMRAFCTATANFIQVIRERRTNG